MSKTNRTNIVTVNSEELKNVLRHVIKNNQFLQEQGKPVASVEVVGESGIGKTSSIIQLADELDLHFVKLNLAQIEEIGDLVGFPVRQYEMSLNDDVTWVDEPAMSSFKDKGYSATGRNRMGYAAPEWISNTKDGGLLLLDDWNRADPRFIQAVMELVDRQEYISWKLPKNWHIILTSNPESGDYSVNSIDSAQRTRFISVNLEFNIETWARWAEENKIDGRCINFLLMNPDLVKNDTNARSITTFFNSISSFESFESNLPMVQILGEGSVGEAFSSMFTMFINNRLDLLIKPEDILNKDKEDVIKRLKSNVKKNDDYRADIASTLVTRITNYINSNYKDVRDSKVIQNVINRIADLVTEDVFGVDLKFVLVKDVYKNNPDKFRGMFMHKDLMTYALKD